MTRWTAHNRVSFGRKAGVSLYMCFIDLQKAYGTVDRTLLWQVLTRIGVPPQMIAVIQQFHDAMRVCMRPDDGVCSHWFEVEQGLRQRCALSPQLFKILFAAVLTVVLKRFSKDSAILAELVHLKEPPKSTGPEPAMDYARRAVWGMLYADDACIVLRSPQGLAKMMEVIGEVCRASALTVSAKKAETMCMPPPRTPRTMVQVEAAGQTYTQVQSFTYLGGAVTEAPGISVENARQTRACWMRIRRYLRELYDQPKVASSLKTRMVKRRQLRPSCMDGCSTLTLWMQYVDPSPGTLRQTPYRTPPSLASYHRSIAQETRPSDDFGEKPTFILYTYINHHAEPPIITKHKHCST